MSIESNDILTTGVCRSLGVRLPLVSAPIGSASTPELTAAVSNAGALGMLSLTWVPDDEAAHRLTRVRQLTGQPFGVNLVLDFAIERKLAICLEDGVPIISTFWGDPATVNQKIKTAGAWHLHTVGTADEAKRAVDAGVDVIVTQGWEAGGHVRGHVASLPLIPAVVDAVWPVPVIAAGGIGDGRGLAAVLALGAQAGWLGTRFLASAEAHAHPRYQQQVINADGESAVHTLAYDGGWPGAAHRAIRNSTLTGWETAGMPLAGARPGEGDVLATDEAGNKYERYGDMMPLPGMTGDLEAMALYAGQSAGLVHEVLPAARLVEQICAQAAEVLSRLAPGQVRPD